MERWSDEGGTPGGGDGGVQPVDAAPEGVDEAADGADTPPEGVAEAADGADTAPEGMAEVPEAVAGTPAPTGALTPEASIDAVEVVLDQVDQALARLDDGTYGRCVSCGRPIADARLAGDPTVLACAECAEQTLTGVG